jgi:hypothetical protein
VIDACFGILLDEDAWLCHIYGTTVSAALKEVKLEVRSAEKPARRSVRLSEVCPLIGVAVKTEPLSRENSQKICPPVGSRGKGLSTCRLFAKGLSTCRLSQKVCPPVGSSQKACPLVCSSQKVCPPVCSLQKACPLVGCFSWVGRMRLGGGIAGWSLWYDHWLADRLLSAILRFSAGETDGLL